MVKNCRGFIICNKCQQGIGILTNIDRNSSFWENAHYGECSHFKFFIDSLTKSTFTWFNDEIALKYNAVCNLCNGERSLNIDCKGTETDSGIEVKNCCGVSIIFTYEFLSFFNSFKIKSYEDEYREDKAEQQSTSPKVEQLVNLTKITFNNSEKFKD